MKKLLSIFMAVLMLASLFAFGASANDNYIEISTEEELRKIGDDNHYNKAIKLTADITLTSAWTTVEYFEGTLDGSGHKITGLTGTGPMFDTLDMYSIVKNITFVDMSIENSTKDGLGGIAYTTNGTIYNLTFDGLTVSGQSDVGGISYKNYGSISNINITDAAISTAAGKNRAGGIVAYNYATNGVITYCTVAGAVSGGFHIGGIAANNKGMITNCINYASITADSSRAAGISATNDAGCTVSDCGNYGTVIAKRIKNIFSDTAVSGIGGFETKGGSTTVVNCFNAGKLISTYNSYYIAGISGLISKDSMSFFENNNCYTVAGTVYRYNDNTNGEYSAYANGEKSGAVTFTSDAEGATKTNYISSGTVVTASDFAKAEMVTKLGSAFVLSDDANYPIALAADTSQEPGLDDGGDDQTPNDNGDENTETEPNNDVETEVDTEAETTAAAEDEGGCGGMIGVASVGVAAVCGVAAMAIRKKKED